MATQNVFAQYIKAAKTQSNMNISELSDNSITIDIACPDGEATTRIVSLWPGVFLGFNNVSSVSFLAYNGDAGKGIKLSYCVQGRAELQMMDGRYLFLEPGTLTATSSQVKDSFSFPTKKFFGIELFFSEESLRARPEGILAALNLDTGVINGLLDEDDGHSIIANSELEQIFKSLLIAPNNREHEWLQLKCAELLLLLEVQPALHRKVKAIYFTPSQVEIAKQVKALIEADLSKHYTIEKLSERYGISASSLKNYFKGVYGLNISSFLRRERMEVARRALAESDEPVIQIAAAIGYENASKFSAAFKTSTGMKPLEYRRQSRCGLTNQERQ